MWTMRVEGSSASSYDDDFSPHAQELLIVALEDRLSERIGDRLAQQLRRVNSGRAAADALTRKRAAGTLEGRYFWNKRTEDGLRKAVEYFRAAIVSDPEYAPPYAGLADCFNLLSSYGAIPPNDACPAAVGAATNALTRDSRLAEAHTSLAYSRFIYDWDWAGAEAAFKRAVELNSDYATAHHLFADYLTARGRFDEALSELQRAQELEPLSLIVNTDVSWALFHARRYGQARHRLSPTLEMDPAFAPARWVHGLNLLQDGLADEAIGEFEIALQIVRDSPFVLGSVGHAFAVVGRAADALRVIERLHTLAAHHYVSPYHVATIYAGLGEKDLAFQYLDQAFVERAHWLTYLAVVPLLDCIREDARFDRLARRIGIESESTRPASDRDAARERAP